MNANPIPWLHQDSEGPYIMAPSHLQPWANRAKEFLKSHALNDLVGFATSGSSGAPPKLILFTQEALKVNAIAANKHLNAHQGDWCNPLPYYHVGGAMIWLRAHFAGVKVSPLHGKWNALQYQKLIRETNSHWSSLVPTQVVDIVSQQLQAPESLKTIIVGGGKLDEKTGLQARNLGWPIVQSYGMTEAGSQIATAFPNEPFHTDKLTILPHWEVTTDNNGLASIHGEGQLWGRLLTNSDDNFILEKQNPDLAWKTQDIVELKAGQLTFIRRADRLVKVLGELVDLDSITLFCQQTDPNIQIETIPDIRQENKLVACGPHKENLMQAISLWNNQAIGYQKVHAMRVLKIPTNLMGKIARRELKNEITSDLSKIISLP